MRSRFYKRPDDTAPPRPAPLRDRSFVAVYSDAAQSRFVSYAQITAHEWCPIPGAYNYELTACQNDNQLRAWDFHIRPVDASEIRQLFILIRNPSDQP
jgi:hypothetical protein